MTKERPARLARFAAPPLQRAWAMATDTERQEFIADNFPELAIANALPAPSTKAEKSEQMVALVAAFVQSHNTPTDADITGEALDRQRHKQREILRRLSNLLR